jgi:hypothetical protein
MIAWQDAWQVIVPILFIIGGVIAWVHKMFVTKGELKSLTDAALQRHDATKDMLRMTGDSIHSVKERVAEIRSLIDRALLSRDGK